MAVANAGGLEACGALMMKPDEIELWCAEFRKDSRGEFQINLWIPETPPVRLCRQARAHRGGRDNDHAGVQWAARTQRSNGIGSGGKRSEGSSPGAISRPGRIDPRNEGEAQNAGDSDRMQVWA